MKSDSSRAQGDRPAVPASFFLALFFVSVCVSARAGLPAEHPNTPYSVVKRGHGDSPRHTGFSGEEPRQKRNSEGAGEESESHAGIHGVRRLGRAHTLGRWSSFSSRMLRHSLGQTREFFLGASVLVGAFSAFLRVTDAFEGPREVEGLPRPVLAPTATLPPASLSSRAFFAGLIVLVVLGSAASISQLQIERASLVSRQTTPDVSTVTKEDGTRVTAIGRYWFSPGGERMNGPTKLEMTYGGRRYEVHLTKSMENDLIPRYRPDTGAQARNSTGYRWWEAPGGHVRDLLLVDRALTRFLEGLSMPPQVKKESGKFVVQWGQDGDGFRCIFAFADEELKKGDVPHDWKKRSDHGIEYRFFLQNDVANCFMTTLSTLAPFLEMRQVLATFLRTATSPHDIPLAGGKSPEPTWIEAPPMSPDMVLQVRSLHHIYRDEELPPLFRFSGKNGIQTWIIGKCWTDSEKPDYFKDGQTAIKFDFYNKVFEVYLTRELEVFLKEKKLLDSFVKRLSTPPAVLKKGSPGLPPNQALVRWGTDNHTETNSQVWFTRFETNQLEDRTYFHVHVPEEILSALTEKGRSRDFFLLLTRTVMAIGQAQLR